MDHHDGISCEGTRISLRRRLEHSTKKMVLAQNFEWRAIDPKKALEFSTLQSVEAGSCASACALAELRSAPCKHSSGFPYFRAIKYDLKTIITKSVSLYCVFHHILNRHEEEPQHFRRFKGGRDEIGQARSQR